MRAVVKIIFAKSIPRPLIIVAVGRIIKSRKTVKPRRAAPEHFDVANVVVHKTPSRCGRSEIGVVEGGHGCSIPCRRKFLQ